MSRWQPTALAAISMATLWAQGEGQPVLQPIAFSHKTHTSLGVKCMDCHEIRPPGFEASIPQESFCMGCHSVVKTDSPEIKRLAEFHANKKPVPWVRVYQVPDFVWFSHEVHVQRAHLDCEECHGPVREREVIAKEKPTTMNSCIACHEMKKAPTRCDLCHDIH